MVHPEHQVLLGLLVPAELLVLEEPQEPLELMEQVVPLVLPELRVQQVLLELVAHQELVEPQELAVLLVLQGVAEPQGQVVLVDY